MRGPLALAALLAAGLALGADPQAGEALAQRHCAACHAVGRAGDSPVAAAPPFRELGRLYPVENLQEALAEGITVSHEGIQMPELSFAPEEIDALIAHLQRIQVR
ncbi:MAG TPA: cytochrome c [Salinarimonas sp.]|nr:cytochrome c [Salinarimonas sp.]